MPSFRLSSPSQTRAADFSRRVVSSGRDGPWWSTSGSSVGSRCDERESSSGSSVVHPCDSLEKDELTSLSAWSCSSDRFCSAYPQTLKLDACFASASSSFSSSNTPCRLLSLSPALRYSLCTQSPSLSHLLCPSISMPPSLSSPLATPKLQKRKSSRVYLSQRRSRKEKRKCSSGVGG